MKKYDLERLFCALCAAGQVQNKKWGQASLSLPLVPAGGHPCWPGLPGPWRPWGIPVPLWQPQGGMPWHLHTHCLPLLSAAA